MQGSMDTRTNILAENLSVSSSIWSAGQQTEYFLLRFRPRGEIGDHTKSEDSNTSPRINSLLLC